MLTVSQTGLRSRVYPHFDGQFAEFQRVCQSDAIFGVPPMGAVNNNQSHLQAPDKWGGKDK
jgi:hypothetical protein